MRNACECIISNERERHGVRNENGMDHGRMVLMGITVC